MLDNKVFTAARDAHAAGWFSRRYRTSEVHNIASLTNAERWERKFTEAYERQANASLRTIEERVARLLPGGSHRERAKLRPFIRNRKLARLVAA